MKRRNRTKQRTRQKSYRKNRSRKTRRRKNRSRKTRRRKNRSRTRMNRKRKRELRGGSHKLQTIPTKMSTLKGEPPPPSRGVEIYDLKIIDYGFVIKDWNPQKEYGDDFSDYMKFDKGDIIEVYEKEDDYYYSARPSHQLDGIRGSIPITYVELFGKENRTITELNVVARELEEALAEFGEGSPISTEIQPLVDSYQDLVARNKNMPSSSLTSKISLLSEKKAGGSSPSRKSPSVQDLQSVVSSLSSDD